MNTGTHREHRLHMHMILLHGVMKVCQPIDDGPTAGVIATIHLRAEKGGGL